jgi:hypothetical protein
VGKIYELAMFYPDGFTQQEWLHLRIQAQHYELDAAVHSEMSNLSTISNLCQGLEIRK